MRTMSGGDRAQRSRDARRAGRTADLGGTRRVATVEPPGTVARRRSRSDVARLRERRRKPEGLSDNGFGGPQHGGGQRRQVEGALAGALASTCWVSAPPGAVAGRAPCG